MSETVAVIKQPCAIHKNMNRWIIFIILISISFGAAHARDGEIIITTPDSSDMTNRIGASRGPVKREGSKRRQQIMDAVRGGDTAQLKQLLKSAQSSDISSALRWAVAIKEVNTARLILNSGYDASQDKNRNHTLNLAINNNDTEMVRLLVNKGLAANIETRRGRDPLENARRRGNQEIVDMLVKARGLK